MRCGPELFIVGGCLYLNDTEGWKFVYAISDVSRASSCVRLVVISGKCHIQGMKTVTLSQAKSRLKSLVRLVEAGEEVEIVEKRRPVARLVPPVAGQVNWEETFSKLESIWGTEPIPGLPGSEIVSQGRR